MADLNLEQVLARLGKSILGWVKDSCVNNLTSESTNTPLSAAQGKKLNDMLTEIKNQGTSTIRSHIGMVIQSTTLDTEEKVINVYGGTAWTQIEGKMLLGVSESHAVNTTGGAETHTLSVAEIPSHDHTFSGKGSSDDQGNHTHGVGVSGTTGSNGNHSHTASRTGTASAGAHTHSFSGSGNTSGNGSHTHSFSWSGNTGSNGSHSHNITVSGTVGKTGGGNAFSTMPPYKAVYIWERTA